MNKLLSIFALLGFIRCTADDRWNTVTEFDLEPLHAVFNFNEASGLDVTDSSVYKRNARIEGNAGRVTGKSGGGVEFVQLAARVEFPTLYTQFYKKRLFSGMLWIKFPSTSTGKMVLLEDPGTDTLGYGLYIQNGSLQFRYNNASVSNSSRVLNSNQWYQVAVRTDAGSVEFFVDGSSTGKYSINPIMNSINNPGKGFIGGYSAQFNGVIDEVKLYTSLATESEIQAHYNEFR